MHLKDLPTPLRALLYTTAVGEIRPVVLITASTKTLIWNGTSYVWRQSYERAIWQDAIRLANAPVRVSLSKPVLPNDGLNENLPRASEMNLEFINTDTVFSATQIGAMFNPDLIEQAQFHVFAQIDGQALLFPIYKGRAVGLPLEEPGKTVFTIRDSLWDLVRTPVLYAKKDNSQQTQVVNGTIYNQTHTFGTASEAVEMWDGIVAFTEEGSAYTSITNSKGDDVELMRVGIGNRALPGKYEIEFIDSVTFRVTYPDNEFLMGQVTNTYPLSQQNQTVTISPSDWNIVGDPRGAKITFQVANVWGGNPVALIEMLLEWGLGDTWGQPLTKPVTLRVDWAAFQAVRQRYSAFRCTMYATNKDNGVWLRKKGQKPKNVLGLCQELADHIGATIIVDNWGFVSITAPGFYAVEPGLISDAYPAPAILSFRILAQERDNFFTFKYGMNDVSGNTSAVRLYDRRATATDDKVEKVMAFPFYRQTVNQWEMEAVSQQYMDTIFTSYARIEMKVKPNWGLPIMPGDRFRVITSMPPLVDMYVEVYSVDKSIGGEAVVAAIRVAPPNLNLSTYCDAVFCEAQFC